MFKIIEGFVEDKVGSKLIKYTGGMCVIVGVFLNINLPDIVDARRSLGYVQLFLLSLLIILFIYLSYYFVKYAFNQEKSSHIYKTSFGAVTVMLAMTLIYVLLHLFNFITISYSDIISRFLVDFGIMMILLIASIFLFGYIEKKEEKIQLIWLYTMNCLVISVLASFVGFFLQGHITGWFYFYWFIYVLPIVFVSLLIACITISKLRNIDLLKPHKRLE